MGGSLSLAWFTDGNEASGEDSLSLPQGEDLGGILAFKCPPKDRDA
jgi:hypothetical protein